MDCRVSSFRGRKTYRRLPRTETNSHAKGRDTRVEDCSGEGCPAPLLRQLEEGETCTQPQTLEHLMENDDDEQSGELARIGQGEGETDDDLKGQSRQSETLLTE